MSYIVFKNFLYSYANIAVDFINTPVVHYIIFCMFMQVKCLFIRFAFLAFSPLLRSRIQQPMFPDGDFSSWSL